METENIIAVSPTANDNEDPDFPELSSTRRRSFWN